MTGNQLDNFTIKAKKNKLSPLSAQCPVDYAFQRIGGKHKGRAIWQLRNGTLRYGQLKKAMTGITPKMLTQVLREMEDDGLVNRRVFLEVPPHVEYTLTACGKELIPFIDMLRQWGEEQMETHGMATIPY